MRGRVGDNRKEQTELREFLRLTLSTQTVASVREAFVLVP